MFATSVIEHSYINILKPIFFKKDPEDVHDRVLVIGNILGKYKITKTVTRFMFNFDDKSLEQDVDGLNYRNPVGLSAGFDKDANLLNIIHDVGFSFAEIGSITRHPYGGNPKPRLHRLKKDKGLLVYYGLKNEGVEAIIKKVRKNYQKTNGDNLGISIARTNSKEASGEAEGIQDYFETLKLLVEEGIGDYYTINISCPNTYYGEPYSTPERLQKLLSKLYEVSIDKPMYLKMPINLDWENFKELLEVAIGFKVNGVIIGNLNKDRNSEYISEKLPEGMKGGVSGLPTRSLSNELIKNTYKNYSDKLTIIGVGGINSIESAYEKICYGASLVQLITGMIFNGPQLIGQINKGISHRLKEDGFKNITEATGSKAF